VSESTPENAAAGEAPGGVLGHVERWFAEHAAPELASLEARLTEVEGFLQEHAAQALVTANNVASLVKAAAPAFTPEVVAVQEASDKGVEVAESLLERVTAHRQAHT
jgi:hypothetical protein